MPRRSLRHTTNHHDKEVPSYALSLVQVMQPLGKLEQLKALKVAQDYYDIDSEKVETIVMDDD